MKAILFSLLETSLYAAAVAGGILLFQLLFKKRVSARLNYLCWGLLVLRLLLPATFESGLHLDRLLPAAAPAAAAQTMSADDAFAERAQGAHAYGAAEGDLRPASPNPGARDASMSSGEAAPAAAKIEIDWYAAGFCAWLAGMALCLAWLSFVKLRFNRRVEAGAVPADRATRALFLACGLRAGVKTQVRLLVTREKLTPSLALVGLRPTVIVPESLVSDAAVLRYAMLHELSHLRRGDHFVLSLCALLRCAYWFNPAVWFAFPRMQADMESACDARVLQLIAPEEKRGYLTTLLSLFTSRSQPALGMARMRSRRLARKRLEDAFRQSRTGRFTRLAAAALCLALLFTCFTTACQPTPEVEIVVNKGDDVVGEAISGTAAPLATTAAPELTPEPVRWTGEFENAKGSIKITANALVVTPNVAAYPVYLIDPCANFSQEFVNAVHQQLLSGCELVNANKQMTRAEAEQAYLQACRRLAELEEKGTEALSVIADGNTLEEQLEDEIDCAKEDVKRYGELMKTAPESVPDAFVEPDAFRVMNKYGDYGFDSIPQIGEYGRRAFALYNGNDGTAGRDRPSYFTFMLGPQYDMTTAYNASRTDWRNWQASAGAVPGTPPFSELPNLLDMTEEEARAWALGALARAGFPHELRVLKCFQYGLGDPEASDGRDKNNYAWVLTLEPVVDGIPVFSEVSRRANDPYETACSYQDEEITMAVNDTGLHELTVMGHFSSGERLNANVALIDIETVKERVVHQLLLESAHWDEHNKEGTLEITIERIELGYGRAAVKDDPAGQMLIPMWNVYCAYKSPGQEPYYRDFPAVTLNAIDGSRM